MERHKKRLLVKGIIYDVIGMASTAVPLVGSLIDVAWAPYASKQMSKMYPGKKGKLASILVFIEEILPFTDIIPSFTLMWVYTFVFNSQAEVKAAPVPVMS